jgi:hypothetical protein
VRSSDIKLEHLFVLAVRFMGFHNFIPGRFEWILHIATHFSFSFVHGGSATLSGLWAAAE